MDRKNRTLSSPRLVSRRRRAPLPLTSPYKDTAAAYEKRTPGRAQLLHLQGNAGHILTTGGSLKMAEQGKSWSIFFSSSRGILVCTCQRQRSTLEVANREAEGQGKIMSLNRIITAIEGRR